MLIWSSARLIMPEKYVGITTRTLPLIIYLICGVKYDSRHTTQTATTAGRRADIGIAVV